MKSNRSDLQQLECVINSFIVSKTIPSFNIILDEPVKYFLKKIQEVQITNLNSLVPNFEEAHVMSAVYVKCSGDLNIGVLWYMLEEESKPLAVKLLGASHLNKFDKLAVSSISEIGNILTASIVNAICDEARCKIYTSVPGFAVESLRALLETIASDFGDQSDTVIASVVEFFGVNSKIKLKMILVQDPKETKKLIA
ncbi:MAG: chemotaxis protein CheC [Nitrosotalea sp.]